VSSAAGEMVPFEAGTLVILVQRLQRTGQPKQIMAPQYVPESSPGRTQPNGAIVIQRFWRSHDVRRLVYL
jgi:hypothetical protein